MLGLTKELSHKVWEFKGPTVAPHTTRSFHDLHKYLQVPVMPPTLAEVCKVIQIYYLIKVRVAGVQWKGGSVDKMVQGWWGQAGRRDQGEQELSASRGGRG